MEVEAKGTAERPTKLFGLKPCEWVGGARIVRKLAMQEMRFGSLRKSVSRLSAVLEETAERSYIHVSVKRRSVRHNTFVMCRSLMFSRKGLVSSLGALFLTSATRRE